MCLENSDLKCSHSLTVNLQFKNTCMFLWITCVQFRFLKYFVVECSEVTLTKA